MEEYMFTICRRFVATTLILSLLWPDMARCMEDKQDDLPKIGFSQPLQRDMISQEEQNRNMKKEEDPWLEPTEDTPLISKEVNIQDNELKDETLSQKYARLLNINLQDWDQDKQNAWNNLVEVEGACNFTWANLNPESIIYKLLFTLTTNEHAVNEKKPKKCCPHLWLYGRAIPLEDKNAIKSNVMIRTLGSTLAETILDIISTTLGALIGYQLYEVFHSRKAAVSWSFIVDFFSNVNSVSFLGIINALYEYPALLYIIIAVPVTLGFGKAVLQTATLSQRSDESAEKTRKSFEEKLGKARSDKWGKVLNVFSALPLLSYLIDFLHPIKDEISRLENLLLWNAKLSSKEREKSFQILLKAARERKGIDQMGAIEALAHLAHGWNINNLKIVPSDREEFSKIKVTTLNELKKLYQDNEKLPFCSLNKLRTGSLLWEIGQSPSLLVTRRQQIIKTMKVLIYGFTFYTLVKILYKYYNCPDMYRKNFTWLGGLTPYASNYSKECFDTQVKVFNTIPGQPVGTLVGNLTNYRFPNNSYDLDLSNKVLNSSVIAEIVEGFQRANVSLNSLNISNTLITNSSDIVRILAALPSTITNLDMENMSSEIIGYPPFPATSFLGLSRLTSLKSLNISRNYLSPSNNNAIGEVLQKLSHLQELRLGRGRGFVDLNMNLTQVAQALKSSLRLLDLTSNRFSKDEDQIALGKALAQNLTLNQLYLKDTWIGRSAKGNVALARGLKAQANLRLLDLSWNPLGYESNVNASALLGSLPSSLTHLDVDVNAIGYLDLSDIYALAQAIQNMSSLAYFKAGRRGSLNAFGKSPTFLQSLQGKYNLTYLDLSNNFFNDISKMRDVLNTTPHLKLLDLSANGLTNGGLIAPVLSTLRNLTSLKLEDNSFTTKDRLEIWNATSFLPKTPFYLNEDLAFTKEYLKSLPSTTISLDFAGKLKPTVLTNLRIIMPQVISFFPRLIHLDLSENAIIGMDPEGMEALISFLPQLKNLQSLDISNSLSSSFQGAEDYYQKLSYAIGQLPKLRSLDLSQTNFIHANSLGQGLSKSQALTSINLSGCWKSSTLQWHGGLQLIKGLQAHSHLTSLDLSWGSLGSDPTSTHALADALGSWLHLQYLNLGYNWIGWEDSNSSLYFLEKLADSAKTINKEGKRTLEINLLKGIHNVTWTQGAETLRALTEKTIIDGTPVQAWNKWGESPLTPIVYSGV